jgi:hypothetical protein
LVSLPGIPRLFPSSASSGCSAAGQTTGGVVGSAVRHNLSQPQPTSANRSPLRAFVSILSSGGNSCTAILARRVSKPGFDGRAHGRAGSQKRAAQLTAMDSICRATLEYKCLFVSEPANDRPLAAWPVATDVRESCFPRRCGPGPSVSKPSGSPLPADSALPRHSSRRRFWLGREHGRVKQRNARILGRRLFR